MYLFMHNVSLGGGGLNEYMFRGGEHRCVHMMRYSGACCCDCMSVFMVMHVCGGVLGVQLGGRCCWHGQWIFLVHVTGFVVGLAVVFFWCVCST